jgi:hypothetical protein
MKNALETSRRDFLQTTLVAGGFGLSLDEILRLQAHAAPRGSARADTSVIQIWLGGGPSQFETFDPKPDAPVEVRGPYSAISSKLPGVLLCEKLPRTAMVLDRATIIRTITHPTNDHFGGAHRQSTGNPSEGGRSTHPSAGAMASHFRGAINPQVPAYVLLSEEQTRNPVIATVMGSAYLGSQHAPFTILQNPFQRTFQPDKVRDAVSSLKLADDFTLARVADRRSLLVSLDRFSRQADATRAMEGLDGLNHLALDMVTSGAARRAFDLNEESPKTRDRYGRHRWGQMGLLARRLVEAGVTFITLNTAPDSLCWDWHRNIANDHRPADGSDGPSRGMDISGPPLDQMLSTLIADLSERGLDRKVLLVVWGEFGRTPKVNATGGRDHWGNVMSMVLAGGGLRMGQVIGTTSPNGEVPTSRPVAPTDVLATIYRHLGIDLNRQTVNRAGRPIPLLPDGTPLAELG